LDGGEAIVEACRKLEVDYILSSPGTEWAPVWEAMANQDRDSRNGPVFMDCWHETLAVDIAAGYTLATGKMQAVLLHAGSGLLQGAMGIHGAWLAGVPMVVISGESMTYGEQDGFDPGAQWINNLSIPGGTTRLIEPVVKFATQAGSPHIVYESVIRAGELAQRAPTGPTYLSVSTETLMDAWTPPAKERMVPAAPRTLSAPEDIERLAGLLAKAENPVVFTEGAGREVETYDALVALCEPLALPVVETRSAIFANFPNDHEMHQGYNFAPFKDDSDLVIVIRTRAPWYPPSDGPSKAVVAVIDETPHRDSMVYQSLQADMYLEGNAAQTLRDLADAVVGLGVDAPAVEARRARLAESHNQIREKTLGARAEARHKTPIDPVWLCAALGEVMPDDTIYLDEVTSHTPLLREHIDTNRPQSFFTRQGGLGQGLGLSLGVKLAKRDQPVVTLIGDGGFLYNPVLQSLGAARDFDLPIMAVIFNNRKYIAMEGMTRKMYPEGTSIETDNFYGTHINAPDFTKIAEAFGGYGEQVTDPDALEDAIRRGLEATKSGRSVILDVVVG
jgi:thiamine pyrophosphate-dependent acetolactate synthase large subunit-like protein